MMSQRRFQWIAGAAGAVAVAWAMSWGVVTVEAERVIRGRSQDAGAAPASADEPTDELGKLQKQMKELLAQQKEVLANQATILQRFDAVMEELRIIKVRATIRGGS